MRSISADERVRGLYEMHMFLNEQVNFDKLPFNHNCYVEGMPIQTFEAILQNISTRIQLYKFASNSHYNTRSISTLSNESFFSDLPCDLIKSHGYPKACNIPHVMGHVVTLNYFKYNPNKNFALQPTMKVYPVHVLEED